MLRIDDSKPGAGEVLDTLDKHCIFLSELSSYAFRDAADAEDCAKKTEELQNRLRNVAAPYSFEITYDDYYHSDDDVTMVWQNKENTRNVPFSCLARSRIRLLFGLVSPPPLVQKRAFLICHTTGP